MRVLHVALLVLGCERGGNAIAPLPDPPAPNSPEVVEPGDAGNAFAVQGALARVERDPRGELRVIAIELYKAKATCAETPRSDSLTISIEPHGTRARFEFYDDEGELRCPGPDRSAEASVARLALGKEWLRVGGKLRASVSAKSTSPIDARLTGEFDALVCETP